MDGVYRGGREDLGLGCWYRSVGDAGAKRGPGRRGESWGTRVEVVDVGGEDRDSILVAGTCIY